MFRKHEINSVMRVVIAMGILIILTSRIFAKSIFLPSRPPRNAIVLFDGKNTSQWEQLRHDTPCGWILKDGYLQVVPREGDLRTRKEFRDFRLHLEFNIPYMPGKRGQARGNSGVILQNLYEIQVLDSYGIKHPKKNDCGAIYGQQAPLVNACKPPDTWQSYDIFFRAARLDANGKMIQKPVVTVYQNGIEIQKDQPINGPTGIRRRMKIKSEGPIVLQAHGCKVQYCNIWIEPKP